MHDRPQVEHLIAQHYPVTLLSPPGFACYGGCLWWHAMITGFDTTSLPNTTSLLDCADGGGRALEALRLGLPGVILAATAPNFARIAQIAAACGALLLDTAPPALDLAERGADRRLASWLGRAEETG